MAMYTVPVCECALCEEAVCGGNCVQRYEQGCVQERLCRRLLGGLYVREAVCEGIHAWGGCEEKAVCEGSTCEACSV